MMSSVDMEMDDIFEERGEGDLEEVLHQSAGMPDLDLNIPDGDDVAPTQGDGEGDAEVLARLQGAAKKKTMKPQPKLDPARLKGDRGLPILPKVFEKIKFRGRGHEAEDLQLMMRKLEHWGHRLFPKLPFDDLLERLEKLGSKKEVQNTVKRIRLDMPLLDEDYTSGQQAGDEQQNAEAANPQEPVENAEDLFDELIRQEREAQEDRANAEDDGISPPASPVYSRRAAANTDPVNRGDSPTPAPAHTPVRNSVGTPNTVQEDLHNLREKLHAQGDIRKSNRLTEIDAALARTEDGLKAKTEQVLNQLNNKITTLPSLDSQPRPETTWDLRATRQAEWGLKQRVDRLAILDSSQASYSLLGTTAAPLAIPTDLKVIPNFPVQLKGPTPGQQVQIDLRTRAQKNPFNQKNREVLQESYGVQLPTIKERKAQKSLAANIVKGSTVEPLAVLPAANRRDPQLMPPPITEMDARKGILSLLERGLIPPAAELTLEPSPVKNRMAPLHDPDQRKEPPSISEATFNIANVKLDPTAKPIDLPQSSHGSRSTSPAKLQSPSPEVKSRASSGSSRNKSANPIKTPVTVKTLEMSLQPLPPPTTPASIGDFKERHHKFAVQHGRTRDTSQEFLAFKQHYCLSWGSIVTMLRHLERMLSNYAVPIAFINGDRLADLSLEFELERPPTLKDLLNVIINREDVENLIKRPGRRYVGPNGRDMAACKIQATYRMYRERGTYLDYRRRKWAAGVIAISWIMSIKMAQVRRQLKATRQQQLDAFKERSKSLCKNWGRIQKSRRVVIHLPSLGYTKGIRDSINEFGILQNMQMGRLCDIRDPNVDVIYVCPVPVNEEKLQYYSKLMGLKTAIDSGVVENQGDLSARYKVIVPEAITRFPTHRMCLATHLLYSPKALKRIKNLIRGREAYIVPGVPHKDDLAVSDALGVPMLCPEPEVAHLYTTKSGSKRIFASAEIPVPPSEFDVYSLQQLHECLAQLVTENLEVRRWLFKLDDEFDGRGIAYCDIGDHMKCYGWAVKEAQRYGEKWNKKWAQEAAYIKINSEIPDVLSKHATPCDRKRYPTWEKFLQSFLSQGGVIEACPPSESVTGLTVDMLIEPDGKVNMVSVGDQIHADSPFSCWGLSVPQSSVEPEILNAACFKIAEACKARNVLGYFTIDFLTFIHPKTMEQKLWATDLDLSYSNSAAMFQLSSFMTGATLDVATHYYDIPAPKREEKKSKRRKQPVEEEPPNLSRYAVMSTKLHHTNLSVIHYSVFFQMCRAHGIGYDIKEKQGTVFTLIDGTNRENLGMLAVGDNLQGALATFARNLSVIHQEISAPNMQGESNFQAAIEDIEGILGTTIQNADEQTSGDTHR